MVLVFNVLYSGPRLLPLIFDILIRFRTGKIGIVADVKQAFHQIEIVKEHRDFVRFLWFKDILYNQETITLRSKQVIFGLTCSSFLLNPLIVNPTKWSNTLKQFVGKLPTNCLSVFDHFMGFTLKGLMGR